MKIALAGFRGEMPIIDERLLPPRLWWRGGGAERRRSMSTELRMASLPTQSGIRDGYRQNGIDTLFLILLYPQSLWFCFRFLSTDSLLPCGAVIKVEHKELDDDSN
ncbi:MAG: hypothetical protein GXZ05_09840 [Gammaproteobacteria bacterium]|nr:hypothetical protein [Gammaproteobacteria bacterium]